MRADKTTVFILAGCSGAGKSTLLRRAYKHGIPVFGEEADALFQATNPKRDREMQLFERALPTRLFQGKHVPSLLSLSERPDCFVVHLDLLNLLLNLVSDPMIQELLPTNLRSTGPRLADDLIDKKKNKQVYLHYLKNAFPYADSLIINTLYISYPRVVLQWNQRAELLRIKYPNANPDSFQFLFDQENPRPDLYRAIHDAWFEALEEMECDRAYVCKGAKGILEIKELAPNPGATREYPFLPV